MPISRKLCFLIGANQRFEDNCVPKLELGNEGNCSRRPMGDVRVAMQLPRFA
jgi:hypothetical protein